MRSNNFWGFGPFLEDKTIRRFKTSTFILSILTPILLFGGDTNQTINSIANDRTWKKLLYFDEIAKESEVTSSSFFLSKNGMYDPVDELKSTLDAFYLPIGDNPNNHAVCRFPARYKWLSTKINLPKHEDSFSRCPDLKKSLNETKIDSVSLMFVSGYLGNPASSFGHSFFKLNDSNKTSSNLFDLSVSYGADVPKDENIFAYMYKGLTGKYNADFKDKYFFTQDLVYSSNEFRDIWEYKLNLSKEQISFFRLHLWEIFGKKFKYLFLTKNCGYELSKMLEVVQEHDIAQPAYLWFAPIETFHTLSDIDQFSKTIEDKIYHPSEQKKVYAKFSLLSEKEKELATYFTVNQMDDPDNKMSHFNDKSRINVINFMLSYYNYLLVKNRGEAEIEKLKKKALLARFTLPVEREVETKLDGKKAPDQNDKPISTSLSFNTSELDRNFLTFNVSPYSILSLGENNLNGDEFRVLDTEVGVGSGKAFINKFDLISIKQFERFGIPLEDGLKVSWQLDIGTKRINSQSDTYNSFVRGGIGKASEPIDNILLYSMMNIGANTHHERLTASAEIGAWMNTKAAKMIISGEKGIQSDNGELFHLIKLRINSKTLEDKSIFMDVEDSLNDGWKVLVGVRLFI